MNPVLLESNDNHINNAGPSDINKSGPQPNNHHHHRYSCYSYKGTLLIDNVTKSMLSADEWIAQEIDRLSHNSLPRNCSSFEALVSFVEGYSQTEPYHGNSITIRKDCCSHDINQQHDKKDALSSETTHGCHDNEPSTATSISIEQLTQKNLILAFTRLIKFCQTNESIHYFYIEHHRKPVELLLELEKMYQAWWRNKNEPSVSASNNDNIIYYQNNLGHVLFGANIPIANHLVDSWTIICLWVQQDTSSFLKQQKWSMFGIHSFQIAKKLCGIDTHCNENK